MNKLISKSWLTGLCAALLTLLASPQAQACSVCFGRSQNDQTTNAMSNAILFMLVLVMLMMAAFGAFAYYLYRCSLQAEDDLDDLVSDPAS